MQTKKTQIVHITKNSILSSAEIEKWLRELMITSLKKKNFL